MKKLLLTALAVAGFASAKAQTDVTSLYIENPNFERRYAGWVNEGTTQGAVGGLTHQVNSSFSLKDGQMYLEKYVSSGSVANCHIRQTLRQLPVGTYILTAAAQHTQSSSTDQQTGAYLYAGSDSVEIGAEAADYSVTFQSLGGNTTIGLQVKSATGNWVCLDNIRLTQLDTDYTAIGNKLQQQIDDAQTTLGEGDGETADELTAAIASAQAAVGSTSDSDIQSAAETLRRAALNYELSNGTGTAPKVTTNTFVAMGSTIALGRSTVSGSSIAEQGFCWSATDPEPTLLDDYTTDYFTNNGKVFRMEGLQPATLYYVRAFARTTNNMVTYGDVVRIATKPAGTMAYTYDDGGSDDENARINTAIAETVWMYNHLTVINGVTLSVHYGSSTATADCSYGGYMRVGPSTSYQQTGTLLHETNHGVGVGTHWVWYSNATMRSNTTSGKWLGPHATDMVQFLTNDDGAYMQGDATHMWGGTTSSSSSGMKNWGINGASEDSYSPSDQLLYWGNIMITHSLHIDGLPFNWSQGFATPTYVFEQFDNQKYYLKSQVDDYGVTTFLSHSKTGILRQVEASMTEALANDSLAWYITFDPTTALYTFQNVGSGRYIGLSSDDFRALTSSPQAIQLMPSREKMTVGKLTTHTYALTANDGASALKAGASVSTTEYDGSATTENQLWYLLDADDLALYDDNYKSDLLTDLKALIKNVRALLDVEHDVQSSETASVDEVDAALESTLTTVEAEMSDYASAGEVQTAIDEVESAMLTFLAAAKPTDVTAPFELTFLIENADISSNEGWSEEPTYANSLLEYSTADAFDLNQTISLKMPAGTYKLKAQAFQRPGTYEEALAAWQEGKDSVKAELYLKSQSQLVKNIYADPASRTLGSGSIEATDGVWIPSTTSSAYYFFRRSYYDNEVLCTTTTAATMKLGIRSTKADKTYWTCIDNFRLYYYGDTDEETVTPVEAPSAEDDVTTTGGRLYDLQGRPATRRTKGILIQDGKKIVY